MLCLKLYHENMEKNINNNFECILILKHSDSITSIFLLKDKNIIISSGWDRTKIWNYNNLNLLNYLKDWICDYGGNSIGRIEEDKIIIQELLMELWKSFQLMKKSY